MGVVVLEYGVAKTLKKKNSKITKYIGSTET